MRKNYREALLCETIKELTKKKDDSSWTVFKSLKECVDVKRPCCEILPSITSSLGVSKEAFTAIYNRIELKFEAYEKRINYEIIDEDDPLWPKGAERGENPVHFLYLCGNKDLLTKPRLTVFGAKNVTGTGLSECHRLVEESSRTGHVLLCVIEKGVCQAVLQSALKAKLPVIAVLASPLHQCNPEALKNIMIEIVNSGSLLLTGFAPSSSVEKWFSIPRNRLMIEMSQKLAIPEERDGGPAWMLADIALEKQLPVYVFESLVQNPAYTYAFKYSRIPGVTVIRKKGELKKLLAPPKKREKRNTENPEQLTLF